MITRSGYPERAAHAAWISVTTYAFGLWVQLQNYWFFAPRDADDWGDAAWFVARLPFVLLDYAALAWAVGLVHRGWVRGPIRATAFWCGWLGLQLFLVADQLGYKLAGGHVRVSQLNGELQDAGLLIRELWSSIKVELDPWMWANALAAFALVPILTHPRGLSRRELRIRAPRAVAALYVVVALFASSVGERYGLERHPLLTLAASVAWREDPLPPFDAALADDLERPRYGHDHESPTERAAHASAQTTLRHGTRPPLVLLYVLESVGSRQLFGPDGEVRRELAPNVAELASAGVSFDRVYSPFPSTALAHVAMLTSGPTITWGDYAALIERRYVGPNLVGELSRLGYRVGVFSTGDLGFERLGSFYRGLNVDHIAHYGDGRTELDVSGTLNSWGVTSDEMRRVVVRWIDAQAGRPEPLAVVFLTLETHHPYDRPASHVGPRPGDSLRDHYENALHYTDAVLGRMREDLEQRDLWGKALVLVTGDHGEAFGGHHRGNYGHRNGLFEENVCSFLVIATPRRPIARLASHRVASLGDVGPTLLGLLGGDTTRLPGRDLLDPAFVPRMVYFYTSATPPRWGLCDGRWKYIAGMADESPRLYDLALDPDERRNLAAARPDQLATYRSLCAAWYAKTGNEFVRGLEDHVPDATTRAVRDRLGGR